MKRRYWVLGIAFLAVVTIITGMTLRSQSEERTKTQSLEEVSDSTEEALPQWDISKLTSGLSEEVSVLDYEDLSLDNLEDVYTVETQNKIHDKLSTLKAKKDYGFEEMLAVSNPYLTNTTGLYLHFETENPAKVSYKIETAGYPSFEQTLYNPEGEFAKKHDYQLIGSIAGVTNKITVTAQTSDGDKKTKVITYIPPAMQTTSLLTYEPKAGDSKEELSQGLFAVIGNKMDLRATYLVDNNGIVRAEMPTIDYYSTRLNQTKTGDLLMGISSKALGIYSRLGQIKQIYDVSQAGFELHHDNILSQDEEHIYALATSVEDKEKLKLVEDRVLKLNLKTGAIEAVIDFSELFSDYYKVATGIEETNAYAGFWDPIHLNTVQDLGDDAILVSSRETSTIMKIENVSQEPRISYLISDPSMWEGISNYSDLVLNKKGDFINQTGQHTVTYETDDSLAEGQYYLYMFNNNSTVMDSRKDFDWSAYLTEDDSVDVEHSVSLYYKYLVDENAKSYQLVDSFEVPYSPYLSSTQAVGDHFVVGSGQALEYGEYDKDGTLIKSYTFKGDTTSIYRVFKYDFENFYFVE